MIRITEEQKMILHCYQGGRTKVVHDMEESIKELKSTGEDPEMQELLEDLTNTLSHCTNKEFFQMKKDRMMDTEEEEIPEE